jgi:hypothetical protein
MFRIITLRLMRYILPLFFRVDTPACEQLCVLHHLLPHCARSMADLPPPVLLQAEIPHRLNYFTVSMISPGTILWMLYPS